MKAYVLYGINDLRYVDLEIPFFPSSDWALIKVKATGICSSDIPRIFEKGTYHFPTIPGHEFSGIVEQVASMSNAHLIGKSVGVFPLIPCKECSCCKEKHYEMCSNYDYLGSRRDGGFAEYVMVPVWNLIELPSSIDYTTAAMLEPLSVAYHAIEQCCINNSDSVAVVGTGMIGISAGQWASLKGASNVFIVGRSEGKRSIVEKCGLNFTTRQSDKFDVVVEAVGTPESIENAISLSKPGGKVILMGNPSDNIELTQSTYWKILRQQITLRGTWNSFYDGNNPSDWQKVLSAISDNKISVSTLITHTFYQDDLMSGLKLMKNHSELYCKVMILWNN